MSDEILAALSSLGWLRHASRLGAAGLLDDTEFCSSLDQLATLVKATLAYQSATAGPKPPEPSFAEPQPHRRSSAPNIMSGPWPARSVNSAAAVEAHPPRIERRNSLERISENMPGSTDGSFSEVGLALHSSASPSASPFSSPSPSGSPSTQRRNSSSSHPPTKWSLWQKTEPSTSSSPCGSPKPRRRSLGGRQRRTSSEGALSGREPAQPLVSDAAPHYAEAKLTSAKVNECAHQVLCEAGAIEQPPPARQKRASREHLARNMQRASGETLTGGGG